MRHLRKKIKLKSIIEINNYIEPNLNKTSLFNLINNINHHSNRFLNSSNNSSNNNKIYKIYNCHPKYNNNLL